MRVLAGLLPVQSGTLRFAGELVADAAARRRLRARIGLLTETPGLFEQLSVRENLLVFGRLHGLSFAECERRIADLCAAFELTDRLSSAVAGLSKGLKQRVALVRAVLHQPSMLLLDEPGSGLDPEAAARLHEWIDQIRAQGVACILASHDFAQVRRLGGAVHVLNRRAVRLPAVQPRLHLQLVDPERWCTHLRSLGRRVELLHEDADGAATLVLDAQRAQVPEVLRELILQGAQVHSVQWRETELNARYQAALAGLAT
jgi:ABC-2 type transport system ATP-binding protein